MLITAVHRPSLLVECMGRVLCWFWMSRLYVCIAVSKWLNLLDGVINRRSTRYKASMRNFEVFDNISRSSYYYETVVLSPCNWCAETYTLKWQLVATLRALIFIRWMTMIVILPSCVILPSEYTTITLITILYWSSLVECMKWVSCWRWANSSYVCIAVCSRIWKCYCLAFNAV